jgi:uncharacterized protein
MTRILAHMAIGMLRFYQKGISPYFGAKCRFTPTCSAYGIEAIRKYGALKGGVMAIRRFLSCHPWGRSGYDPVP